MISLCVSLLMMSRIWILGSLTYTGGDIYINGEKQTDIVNSMPGGGGPNGGPQGGGPAPGGRG